MCTRIKASRLIRALKNQIDEKGDMDVMIYVTADAELIDYNTPRVQKGATTPWPYIVLEIGRTTMSKKDQKAMFDFGKKRVKRKRRK